ncbi:MAG: 23S rRNA (guanosine(2251)-2'-O)-methyltransferase RlmB [bacterium]
MPKKINPQNKNSQRNRRLVQVETKNALIELLKTEAEFTVIYIANNAFRDHKTKEIIRLALQKGVPIEKVNRKRMNRISKSSQCESVVGMKLSIKECKLEDLIMDYDREKGLFILILDTIDYTQNVGALYRTAFAAGVDAVIVPRKKNNFLTEDVTRVSMGASERIPTIQMNLFDAVKQLKDSAVRILGLHMEGQTYYQANMRGNIALIVGNEALGISKRMIDKCDELVSIPMEAGIDSLNVSAAGAIVMFEKQRQDKIRPK